MVWVRETKSRKGTHHLVWGYSEDLELEEEILLFRLFEEWMVHQTIIQSWEDTLADGNLPKSSQIIYGPNGVHMGGWRHCPPKTSMAIKQLIGEVHNVFHKRRHR